MTYSFKYLLLRTFAIPTGDDPDKISSDLYTDKLTGASDKSKEKYQPNVYAPKEWPEEAKSAYAEVIARVPDEKIRNAASKKSYGKNFADLGPIEVIQVVKNLQAKEAK
jgi:beta-xylosidase